MSKGLTRKQKALLEEMGWNTTKVDHREKRNRDIAMKNKRRKKKYYGQ